MGYKRAAFLDPAGAPAAFSVELAEKDLRLITALAADLGVPVPQAETTARCCWRDGRGHGAADFSTVAEHLRQTERAPARRSEPEGSTDSHRSEAARRRRGVNDGRIAVARQKGEPDMAQRTLIRGGIVLSQDPAIGELPRADVLIEDDKIVEVGRDIAAADAKVIDAAGDIVIPGFIDTHRHTWETSIRTCAPDFPLITYFGSILDKFAPHYRPEDVTPRPCGVPSSASTPASPRSSTGPTSSTPPTTRMRPSTPSRSRASARSSPTASATRRSWTGGSVPTTRAASCGSMGPTRGGSGSSTSPRMTAA